MAGNYAGDLDPDEAWKLLSEDQDAVMIDCRTTAEWSYVGFPDLEAIGKQTKFIEWETFPDGMLNENFVHQVKKAGIGPDTNVLFLCRSGQRSKSAAIEMTANGYTAAYNVSEGFEGNKDEASHRGKTEGWKVRGLPWKQI